MTRDDIIRMAREAGINPCLRGHPDHPERDKNGNIVFWAGVNQDTFERFAALVASAEREACIDLVAFHGGPVDLEAAIRARGQE